MKVAVTVSLVPEARGGPFVFWDEPPGYFAGACATARSLGYDAVEIFPAEGYVGGDADYIREHLDDNGLSLAAVGTGAGWVRHKLTLTHADAAVRAKARDYVRSIIDFAGPFGAPAIIGSMQGRWGDGVAKDAALGWLGEALAELSEYARQYGTVLLYEPLNRYETNLANTISEGALLLKSAGAANAKLLADLFHMNIEEEDLPTAIQGGTRMKWLADLFPTNAERLSLPAATCNLPAAIFGNPGFIGHVHFVDSNRRPAGMGHIDFAPIVAVLREAGYGGYLSAEALPYPDSLAAAKATIDTFRRLVK